MEVLNSLLVGRLSRKRNSEHKIVTQLLFSVNTACTLSTKNFSRFSHLSTLCTSYPQYPHPLFKSAPFPCGQICVTILNTQQIYLKLANFLKKFFLSAQLKLAHSCFFFPTIFHSFSTNFSLLCG